MKVTEINIQTTDEKKIRLAAYCRVSSSSEDQLHSYAAQIRHYSDYAKEHPEMELYDIYADEGITGTCMEKRDELLRLLKDCKRGKIDRIITKSISRFARNTVELLTMLRELKELGVTVYFEEQGIDSGKINAELIVTLPGLAAQQESVSISQNMRWSYNRRMEAGDFNTCKAPFGFHFNEEKKLVVTEPEAEIVRQIFSLYVTGKGKQAIANLLNEKGVPRGQAQKKWNAYNIHYILNNERYMGDAILQKKVTTSSLPYRKKRNEGEKPQYYVSGSNPSVISKDQFHLAQQIQTQRASVHGEHTNASVITGRLICSRCGKKMRRQMLRGKYYWLCEGVSKGTSPCHKMRVLEEALEHGFIQLVFKLGMYEDEILGNLVQNLTSLDAGGSEKNTKISEIDMDIANLSAKNQMLTKLFNGGAFSTIEYTAKTADIENRLAKLRQERARLLAEDEELTPLEDLKVLSQVLRDSSPTLEFDANLFQEIVDHVTLENNATLTFHLIGGLKFPITIDEKERCKAP